MRLYQLGFLPVGTPVNNYAVSITVNKTNAYREANFASYRFIQNAGTWDLEVSIRGANGNLYLDPFYIEIKKW